MFVPYEHVKAIMDKMFNQIERKLVKNRDFKSADRLQNIYFVCEFQ